MTPRPPQNNRGHNGPPRNGNHQRNHNALRDSDPAADTVDAARDWRRAYFLASAGSDDSKDYILGPMLDVNDPQHSRDGVKLLELIDHLRAEARPDARLLPHEVRFMDHISTVTKMQRAQGRVDGERLFIDNTGAGIDEGDDAMEANVTALIAQIQTEHDAATDARTKRQLKHDMKMLEFYIDKKGYVDDYGYGGQYLDYAAQAHAGTLAPDAPELLDAQKAMEDYDRDMNKLMQANMIMYKRGYNRTVNIDLSTLPNATVFNYQSTPGYSLQAAQQPVPNQPQNPGQQAPAPQNQNPQPAQNHNQQNPAGGNQQQNPQNQQNQNPQQQGGNQQPQNPNQQQQAPASPEAQWRASVKPNIDRALAEATLRLEGNGADIRGVRAELAEAKAKIFRNTKVGRWVMKSIFRSDVAKEIRELEDKFTELTDRKFGLENWADIRVHQYVPGAMKLTDTEIDDRRLNSIETEQNKLRTKTSEHMHNSLVARFCKSIGTFEWRNWKSKHYWIMGAGLALSPFTAGVSGAAAAAILTAAKVDKSFRGMPEATKRMDSEQLMKKLDRSLHQREHYKELTRLAMRRFDTDIKWELAKRGTALGLGATAIGGYYLSAAAAGAVADTVGGKIMDFTGLDEAWREFVGPAQVDPNEWQGFIEELDRARGIK